MSDLAILAGARPPTNVPAATNYNPFAGATGNKPFSFPIGTPIVPSGALDHTVIPGQADLEEASHVVGLASTPGVVGDRVNIQPQGVLTLTAAQWDAITGIPDAGGLTRGAPYYLKPGPGNGELTTTIPTDPGDFIVRVGVALSATDFLILICSPVEVS